MARSKKNEKSVASVRDYQVLVEPVVTEKTSQMGEGGKHVVFKVDPRADKPEIKKAVENIFGVKISKIRTSRYVGKAKKVTGAIGRRSAYKKAFVTLEAGHSIDVVEGL